MTNHSLLIIALATVAFGTASAAAPQGAFSVDEGVYVKLDADNYTMGIYEFFTFDGARGINVEGKRLLTVDEWSYLSDRKMDGKATVNGAHGWIILPDDWTQPAGVSPLVIGSGLSWDTNNYNGDDWSKMSNAGAVFLRAAGYSVDGINAEEDDDSGTYWSATEDNDVDGYAIYFDEWQSANLQTYSKTLYLSVRLAQPVTDNDEAIDNISVTDKAVKRVIGGQLLIKRGDKTFNVLGSEL